MHKSHWVKARKTGPLVIQASLDEESVTASTRRGDNIVVINGDSLNRHALLATVLLIAPVVLTLTCVINGSDMSLVTRAAALVASLASLVYLIPEALCLLTIESLEKHVLSQDEIDTAPTDALMLKMHEQEALFSHSQEKIKNELERRSMNN